MSDWIDNEYAIKYFAFQRNYKQVASMPLKLNCSCPICGDSAKDLFKARFWYFDYKGSKVVHCYNCDYSALFSKFLEEQDEDLYNEYRMDKYKESSPFKSRPSVAVNISEKINAKMPTIEKLEFSTRLDKLNDNHPIIKYVSSRKIPKDKWNRLWFTDKWQDLCNTIKSDMYPEPKPEYRLVIPIFNKNGEIESMQGRALKNGAKNKYLTIKAHDNSSKIYGIDTIDESKDYVLFLEGPIDSLFLDNAMAITGGSLGLDVVPYADKRIWVLDSECRHPDTISRMRKLIDAGERVCFWDSSPWKSKDINDMIVKENANPNDILNYILENSERGMMAQLRMKKFTKFYGD